MARYKDALAWLVQNDDCEWLKDPEPSMSVSACLVADLFRKDDSKVIEDLKKERKKYFED